MEIEIAEIGTAVRIGTTEIGIGMRIEITEIVIETAEIGTGIKRTDIATTMTTTACTAAS
jgi:hypothetical protein